MHAIINLFSFHDEKKEEATARFASDKLPPSLVSTSGIKRSLGFSVAWNMADFWNHTHRGSSVSLPVSPSHDQLYSSIVYDYGKRSISTVEQVIFVTTEGYKCYEIRRVESLGTWELGRSDKLYGLKTSKESTNFKQSGYLSSFFRISLPGIFPKLLSSTEDFCMTEARSGSF
jgi:hypothetical protein